MSAGPVYLETWGLWSYEGPHNDPRDLKTGTHGASVCIGSINGPSAADDEKHECLATMCADSEERAEDRARLAAAAPTMVRALLQHEWCGTFGGSKDHCPECHGANDEFFRRVGYVRDANGRMPPREGYGPHEGHKAGCSVDGALTAAGFPDQTSRDEARHRIGEERK